MTRPPPRMLAIDLALEKTGFAAFNNDEDGLITWTFSTTGRYGHERENLIKAEIARAHYQYRPEVTLLEKLPPKITPGLIGLAHLHGIVRNQLNDFGPYIEVPVSHVKIYATGKGAGPESDKEQVLLAVERRFRHLVTVANNNEADAFTMLGLGRHAYGYPLPTVDGRKLPLTHLRVLDMLVDWPAIEGTPETPVGSTATTKRRSGRAKATKVAQ